MKILTDHSCIPTKTSTSHIDILDVTPQPPKPCPPQPLSTIILSVFKKICYPLLGSAPCLANPGSTLDIDKWLHYFTMNSHLFSYNIFTFSNLDCPLGTYRAVSKVSFNSHCVPCPIGFYSDVKNLLSQCSRCPLGLTTAETGSTSKSQCQVCK